MATPGEIIWAGVMSSKKLRINLLTKVDAAYLTFSFGPYISFRTPSVPIRDFRFPDLSWAVPSRFKPRIHLHVVSKKYLGSLSDERVFRLSWPHSWIKEESFFRCVFKSSGPIFVRIWDYRKHLVGRRARVLLLATRPRRFSFRAFKKRPKIFTPTALANLSLAGQVLPARSKTLRVPKQKRGPFQRKKSKLRPNPEVRTTFLTRALELLPTQPYVSFVDEKEVYRRTWTGVNTPGFGSKRGSQLPVNPHTVDIEMTDYSYGYDLRYNSLYPTTTNFGWGPEYYATSFGGPPLLTDPSVIEIANKAVKRLNSNANLGVQANIAQDLAQFRQTTNMIANSATRLVLSIRALRRGDFSKAAEALVAGRPVNTQIRKGVPARTKTLANNWLELQYGWKPLLSDVDQSMRSLANYMEGSASLQTVQASAQRTFSFADPIFAPDATVLVGQKTTANQTQVRYGVRYRVSNQKMSFLSQLGFTNPINLAWEILPYSFVVDWFIPIGPYLESLSAPHGLEFVEGYKTTFLRKVQQISVSYDGKMSGPNQPVRLNAYADRSKIWIKLERVKLTSYPTQQFPVFKNPLSITHAANALALLRQAFK